MELMMSHLHAGPAVAARGADAAEVTFLVRVWRIARPRLGLRLFDIRVPVPSRRH